MYDVFIKASDLPIVYKMYLGASLCTLQKAQI